MIIQNILQAFSNIISPPYCVACKIFLTEQTVLCDRCITLIKPIVSYEILVGKFPIKVFALTSYEGVIKTLILSKKFRCRVASKQLGLLIGKHLESDWSKFDYMVAVPLHWSRYAFRGYNQSRVIAKELSSMFGIELDDSIKRSRRTVSQTTLSQKMRENNVKDAFLLIDSFKKKYRNKNILIIDDVMTTGSTIKFVSKALLKAKPASITVVVAARVI